MKNVWENRKSHFSYCSLKSFILMKKKIIQNFRLGQQNNWIKIKKAKIFCFSSIRNEMNSLLIDLRFHLLEKRKNYHANGIKHSNACK